MNATLKQYAPLLLTVGLIGGMWFGKDALLNEKDAPVVPPAPQVIVIDKDGKLVMPVVLPTPEVRPDEQNTGEITGPKLPIKIGSRCSFTLPDTVTDCLWELVPPKLERALADNGHTLMLSSDLDGEYVVLASGLRDGKPLLWKYKFTIQPYEKPTPTPAPPGPAPGPGPAPAPTPAPAPAPAPTPTIPAPSAELQTAVADVKTVMAKADPAKAAVFAKAWLDFATALEATTPIATVGEYKSALSTFINAVALQAQLAGAFPGYSVAAEKAFVAYLGGEDGQLDMTKAKAFAQALAWACSR
jgi:hypothetical protein